MTADALHTQVETAHAILYAEADYVLIVKDNQPTLRDDLNEVNWDADEIAQSEHCTKEKGHGRLEVRRGRTVDLQGALWDAFVTLPGRRQGMRLRRSRKEVKNEKTSRETVYVVASLSPQQADPERLMELVRGHWTIENKLYHVHDGSYDEDRCRVAAGELPHNLATLTNVAIALVRREGRFSNVAQGRRHFAHRIQETAKTVLRAA